jgi:hypothetical protein
MGLVTMPDIYRYNIYLPLPVPIPCHLPGKISAWNPIPVPDLYENLLKVPNTS